MSNESRPPYFNSPKKPNPILAFILQLWKRLPIWGKILTGLFIAGCFLNLIGYKSDTAPISTNAAINPTVTPLPQTTQAVVLNTTVAATAVPTKTPKPTTVVAIIPTATNVPTTDTPVAPTATLVVPTATTRPIDAASNPCFIGQIKLAHEGFSSNGYFYPSDQDYANWRDVDCYNDEASLLKANPYAHRAKSDDFTVSAILGVVTPQPDNTAIPAISKERKVTAESSPCLEGQIKGNINSMIYHVPGGASYARTKNNVQCFDTAAQAQAAGFRAAKN